MRTTGEAPAEAARDPILSAMFEARKRVFVDRLGWKIPVHRDRYEIDQFDTDTADYLVLQNPVRPHVASARLLSTERPHLLAELFPTLCENPVPTGPHIREITRFCIDPNVPSAQRMSARNQLVSALVLFALDEGIETYTAVASRPWFRQIVRFGWECVALGPARDVDGEILVGLAISISGRTPAMLKASGIFQPGTFHVRRGCKGAGSC